ncbi:MAG: Lrp/AsnC ligand binding domain-containing protein [Anaerolineales bacterium]|jgi:DNA-binding Lrp family transcriptional regulator
MKAYVLINVRIGGIDEVLRNLRRLEGVIEAHMTFGPYDVVAVVEAADINRLGNMLSAYIHPIPGVLETLTCLAVDS